MSIETWLAFVVATSILLVMPGPTILAVVSYSLTHGRRANPALVAGVALGDSTALVASLLGLGAVLAASVFWFTAIKIVGGLYLLYLGIRMLLATGSPIPVTDEPAPDVPLWRLFVNTYLITALNPKGIIFFVAFVPQFVSGQGDVAAQLWLLAVTFVVLAALNATAYALFASRARRVLASRRAQRRFNLVGGMLLSIAGVWAMLARRA